MKRFLPIFFVLLILSLTVISTQAESPYTTWTLGPGRSLFMTQDAYTPVDEIDLDISGAEDMVVTSDGTIYVADTEHGRVLKLKDFKEVASYGEDVLSGPTGVYVDDKGTIYVADGAKNEIFIFDADGNVLKEFGRPTEPLFGKNKEFLPRKIAVNARQNLYIISEGSVNGIVQMNTNGNFIGYFGANSAKMSLKMILQRLFLTREQLDQFVKNEAASPSNIAIDHQSLVFTITGGTTRAQSIRRFTVSGKNIFPDTFGSTTFRDINVSENGLVLAVDANGQIYEYDLRGTLLFIFGAKDTGDQRLGTLMNPTAIERYQEYIYVLDKDRNAIVVYQTTAFAREVHDGVRLYMDGYYMEAKPYFEKVLNYNGSFIMAYQGIADAYYKVGDYRNALAAYRYAEDRDGYSQAFWELRNLVLQQYLAQTILLLIALSIVQSVVKRFDKRYGWFDPIRAWMKGLLRFPFADDLVFLFRFIKYPADSFYYIKKDQRGSLNFAILIYVWVVLVRIVSLYITGFPFNRYSSPVYIRVENEIMQTVLLLCLRNAAN